LTPDEDSGSRLVAAIEELEEQRAAFVHALQLRSDIVSTLAHDIKGPLTSIVGFAELLEEGYLAGDEATDAARTIRTNAQRLAALANDMLALSRAEPGELEIADDVIDAIEVLNSSVDAVRPQREIELFREVDNAMVRGDADRLRITFDNLLRNAINYSPGGEPVRVDVRTNDRGFAFSFTDLGIGIPLEDLPILFNRFARASNARRLRIAGTGVGLFIVKAIVERHGGTVHVESEIDQGSSFTVILPAASTRTDSTPRVAILISDRRLSRYTAFELRSRGYRVREALSAGDAATGARPGEIIVADAQDVSAQEVRRVLGKRTRIIGLGANADEEWDATLAKPFLISDLIAALNHRG
jgi:signal transduction histidine kinase